MLSIYTLKSALDAGKYYESGDYYAKEGLNDFTSWLGSGAQILNLNGQVNFETFKNLLDGRLPNGVTMSQVEKGQYHRPGYDLTFSAPKSVSILALVSGNKEILEAHREAVREAINKLEEKYAGCRNKINGAINIERTQNLTIATFEHCDSREGDPNLHTHCVTMNATQRADGKWRTLYADELYQDKMLNGMEYRSRLAHKLMTLGYELQLKENGLFEIKGVDSNLIESYSKRRADIEQWLKDNDKSGGKAASEANFMTRDAKVHDNPQQRHDRWVDELTSLGSSIEKLNNIADKAKQRGPVTLPNPVQIANIAVDSAIRHLSERKNTFSFEELVKNSKLISLLACNEGELLHAIEDRIADKRLVYLNDKTLTTPEVNSIKIENIHTMQSGKDAVKKMMPTWIAGITTTFKTDDAKERHVLTSLLTSKDRQIILNSNSKIALHKTLKYYVEISSSQGYYPRIITQNKLNVEPLKHKLGIDRVGTIEGFLLACEYRQEKRGNANSLLEVWNGRTNNKTTRDIWIVDGDITDRQVNRLGKFADTLGARIVFTQLKSISALESLKENGITKVKLKSTQKHVGELRAQEQLVKHIERLDKKGAVQEHSNYEQRHKLAIEQYVNANDKNKLLITLSHAERVNLNNLVRNELKERRLLIGQAKIVDILRPLNMSTEEKSQAHLYQPGDIIRFNKSIANGIEKDTYLEVHKVDLDNKIVELKDKNKQVLWQPINNKAELKHVEVFKPEQRELQKGDILIWTRTIEDRIKNKTAHVIDIKDAQVLVKLQNGEEVNLNAEDISKKHFDYGYAFHLKDVEVKDCKSAVITFQNKQLDNKNITLLNELLTTAKEESIQTKLVSNDAANLKKYIEAGTDKASLNVTETKYERQEALADYQALATQPLFNLLQREYLKINGSNPDINAKDADSVAPELRIACDIVDKVSVYHSERDAVIKLDTLKADVVKAGGLVSPVQSLEQAVNLALEQGWLIDAGMNEYGEKLVTTRHNLLTEQKCIEKMQTGKNQLQPILKNNSTEIKEIIEHKRLTDGQKEAVHLIMTSPDRMVAVQGIAGAGKTTALKEINRLCERNNYTMVLANTASAKNQAKSASGIDAKTTAQFLTRMESVIAKDIEQAKKDFGGNRLFILDESSLASSRELLRLQTVIEKLNARLALVGDFKQQGSIGAGLSFHDLLAYGIDKAVMKENVRLSDPMAFSAMKQAYAGDMTGTLNTLKDKIEEIPDKTEALDRIVGKYFEVEKMTGDAPLVITPMNKDRRYVNENIRNELKTFGKISAQGFMTNVYVPADKREIDKTDIFSYESSDVLRFSSNIPRLGVTAGEYAEIKQIDLNNQRLTLQADGKEFYWAPKDLKNPSGLEIYKQEVREFSKNDTIVFKRNNEELGIFNGDRAKILSVENGTADILLGNGNQVTIDLNQKKNQHLDHGYALTTYAAQGKDVPFVVAYGDGPRSLIRKTSELRQGNVIGVSKDRLPKNFKVEHGLLMKVVEKDKDKLTVKDREGRVCTVKIKSKDTWSYFPPFEKLKPNQLPLTTTQQSFIIQITRGNGLYLAVPNIEHFKNTLEAHKQVKRSALSHIDKDWNKLNDSVNRLVENIKGLAEFKNAKPRILDKNLTGRQQQPIQKDFKFDISRSTENERLALKVERQSLNSLSETKIKTDRQLEQGRGLER